MAIAYVDSTSAIGATITSPLIVTVPGTAAAGQVAIATVVYDTGAVFTAPTGWTLLQTIQGDPSPFAMKTYSRVLISGDVGATVTWSVTSGNPEFAGAMAVYSGVNITTPVDALGSGNNLSASPTAPSESAAAATDMAVVIFGLSVGTLTAGPSAVTQRQLIQYVASGNFGVFLGDDALSASGATGSFVGTYNSSNRWRASTILLSAAPADSSVSADTAGTTVAVTRSGADTAASGDSASASIPMAASATDSAATSDSVIGALGGFGTDAATTGDSVSSAGAVPVVGASTNATNPIGIGPLQLQVPSDAVPGTLLIAQVCLDGGTVTPTTPSGWNLIRTDSAPNGHSVQALYWRVYQSGDPSPGSNVAFAWTGTSAYNSGGIISITGSATAPVDISAGSSANSGSTANAPTLTTTDANDLVLQFYNADVGNTLGLPNTTIYNIAGHGTGASYTTTTTPGVVSAYNATNSANEWTAAQVAIAPALTAGAAVGVPASATDSAASGDNIASTIASSAASADTAVTSDTSSSAIAVARSGTDSAATADSATGAIAQVGAAADSATSGDLASATVVVSVTAGDTTSVIEVASAAVNVGATTTTDMAAFSDLVAGIALAPGALLGSATDNASTGEAAAATVSIAAAVVDSSATGDLTNVYAQANDSAVTGDAATAIVGGSRTVSDQAATSDTPSATIGAPATGTDSLATGSVAAANNAAGDAATDHAVAADVAIGVAVPPPPPGARTGVATDLASTADTAAGAVRLPGVGQEVEYQLVAAVSPLTIQLECATSPIVIEFMKCLGAIDE